MRPFVHRPALVELPGSRPHTSRRDPRGGMGQGQDQVLTVPVSPATRVKAASEESPTWPKQDVLVSDIPRIVLYDHAGIPLVRAVGFRVTER